MRVGQAIYLSGSLFNHSCMPNIHAYFISRTLLIRATTYVVNGCPLEMSYGPQVCYSSSFWMSFKFCLFLEFYLPIHDNRFLLKQYYNWFCLKLFSSLCPCMYVCIALLFVTQIVTPTIVYCACRLGSGITENASNFYLIIIHLNVSVVVALELICLILS